MAYLKGGWQEWPLLMLSLITSLPKNEVLGNYLLKKILDPIWDKAIKYASSHNFSLLSSKVDVENDLNNHWVKVENWSKTIKIKGSKSKQHAKQYIPLDFHLHPLKTRLNRSHLDTVLTQDEMLRTHSKSNIVLLAPTGSGKTSFAQFIAQKIIFDETYFENFNFPILVLLRNLESNASLSDYVIRELSLSYRSEKLGETHDRMLSRDFLVTILNEINAYLILDGFDEIPDYQTKSSVLKEIQSLCLSLESSRILLTSRSGDFNHEIQNTETFEIKKFDVKQIKDFVLRWFGNNKLSKAFFDEIKKVNYKDFLTRPITLASLCAIYERYEEIPLNPAGVNDLLTNLLLEDWDSQRAVERLTNFQNFKLDKRKLFLGEITFHQILAGAGTRLKIYNLKKSFSGGIAIKYGFRKDDFDILFEELETNTSIIQRTAIDTYEFSHKSIQEFLVAGFIKANEYEVLNSRTRFPMFPNELAVFVSISENPSDKTHQIVKIWRDLYDAVLTHKSRNQLDQFISVFTDRLLTEQPVFDNKEKIYACHWLAYPVNGHENFLKFKGTRNYSRRIGNYFRLTKASNDDKRSVLRSDNMLFPSAIEMSRKEAEGYFK